ELDLLPAKELGIITCMFQGQSDVADYYLNDYSEFFNKGIPLSKQLYLQQ
ncbi:HAD family hydrolase, partial [Bacillus paranthracis]|nr:HAD family hydrolase [Bacillus paranthracis]